MSRDITDYGWNISGTIENGNTEIVSAEWGNSALSCFVSGAKWERIPDSSEIHFGPEELPGGLPS